jgi:hypothetical protein
MVTNGAGVSLTIEFIGAPQLQGDLSDATRDKFGNGAAAAERGLKNGDEALYWGKAYTYGEYGLVPTSRLL